MRSKTEMRKKRPGIRKSGVHSDNSDSIAATATNPLRAPRPFTTKGSAREYGDMKAAEYTPAKWARHSVSVAIAKKNIPIAQLRVMSIDL
jgi:hypothetical protein